ncbi:hypothetical protein T439DRAFT_60230 [Meredithblackwellia eburnea MCA 4105]
MPQLEMVTIKDSSSGEDSTPQTVSPSNDSTSITSDIEEIRAPQYFSVVKRSHQQDIDEPPRKKRRTRNGKVVGVLRKQIGQQPAELLCSSLDLAPSATNSRLFATELSTSLTHHLLQVSSGEISAPHSPPVIDLGSIFTRVRNECLTRRSPDPIHEILLASLIAISSRRTQHSSLTGSNVGGSREKSDGGATREVACRTLAHRAVDLAEKANLINDSSPRAMEAVFVLRMCLYATIQPYFPFAYTLATHMHTVYKAEVGSGQPRIFAPGGLVMEILPNTMAIAESDCYLSVMSRKPPKISLAELQLVYGWEFNQVSGALAVLKHNAENQNLSVQMREPGRIVVIGVLRTIIRVQRQTTSSKFDFGKFHRALQESWKLLTELEYNLALLKGLTVMGPHLAAIPQLSVHILAPFYLGEKLKFLRRAETILLSEVYRAAKETPDETRDLVLEGNRRFLRWLKIFIAFMEDEQFLEGPEKNHIRATFLLYLEYLPEWVDLLVTAAREHELARGPLADIGISWTAVFVLRNQLHLSSEVFARSGYQESRVVQALQAHGKLTEDNSNVAAMALVANALSELDPSANPYSFWCPTKTF